MSLNPQNIDEQRKLNKFTSVKIKLWDIFDKEAELGSNMWTAFNAVTNHIDHNTTYRGERKAENKFYGNLYGTAATKKDKILSYSLNSL